MKVSQKTLDDLQNVPIIGPNLEGILKDFATNIPEHDDDDRPITQSQYDACFMLYISGILNAIDPKSNFNRHYKLNSINRRNTWPT